VNRSGTDDELGTKDEKADKAAEKDYKPVITKIKNALGERVKDVKLSKRLHDSPSCIVADADDPSIQMAQLLKAMGQADNLPEIKPILEVNSEHPLLAALRDTDDALRIADISGILLDQALLVEGVKLKDPADFVKRLNRLLVK
jgi:molecular chaperone HtpG